MTALSPVLQRVRTVAVRLDDLIGDVVFLGGATTELLITDPGAAPARPTKDVDVAIEVGSRLEYANLQRKLYARGFHEDVDEDAPLCRWQVDGIKVDVMPTDESILGFANRWHLPALRAAASHPLDDTVTIHLMTAPYFVASKLEAFDSRGGGDYQLSHDLEDIIAIVDGRAELADEIASAEAEVADFVRARIAELLAIGEFVDALPGHLLGDAASQARLPALKERLQELTKEPNG